ncbi:hypothetical protein [Pseudomonas phage GP100]|nr:hypothetical protein [Pseudomonas phage GP100]
MVIYIWPNGEWIYAWEVSGFTMKHSTVPEGGRWVDLDNLHAVQPQLSVEEKQAICEALGSE